MNIIASLKGLLGTDRQKAREAYIRLVREAANGGKADLEQSREVLFHAGKTLQDLEADVRIILDAIEFESQIAKMPSWDELHAKSTEAESFFTYEAINKRRLAEIQLQDNRTIARANILNRMHVEQRLAGLKAERPELFA
jgi:hypothetical protein